MYHTSATGAGVKLLPLILVQVFFLVLSSRLIPYIGRFKPFLVAGPMMLCIGSGLLYSVGYHTPNPKAHLYGYQVVLGAGVGVALQNTNLSVQYELKSEPWLISAGTGLVIFGKSSSFLLCAQY